MWYTVPAFCDAATAEKRVNTLPAGRSNSRPPLRHPLPRRPELFESSPKRPYTQAHQAFPSSAGYHQLFIRDDGFGLCISSLFRHPTRLAEALFHAARSSGCLIAGVNRSPPGSGTVLPRIPFLADTAGGASRSGRGDSLTVQWCSTSWYNGADHLPTLLSNRISGFRKSENR